MCQPKPGPRCSSHAHGRLNAARAQRDQAAAALAAARNPIPPGLSGYLDAVAVEESARHVAHLANYEFQQAQREFETTPAGQRALQSALERLEADPNETAAAFAVRNRLAQARRTREQQIADLAAVRATADRLEQITPGERAALDQVDQAVQDADRAVAGCQRQVQDARTAEQALEAVRAAREEEFNRLGRQAAALAEPVRQAQRQVQEHAQRLYTDAGVSTGYARFYADDMVQAKTPRTAGQVRAGETPPVTGALSMKVKRTGPDGERTRAAAAAAQTDAQYLQANATLAEACAAHRRAQAEARHVYDTRLATLTPDLQNARGNLRDAEHALAAAERQAQQSHGQAGRLRAQIAAGAGPDATSVTWQQASTQVVRNPDGTVNAWVLQAPTDAHPHGQYVRAVGITTVSGSSGAANALVLEDGSTAYRLEHYYRNTRGAQNPISGPDGVLIAPPQPGARPLREESQATAGFSVFIDSTD
jgi:hypothetical protein